MPRPPLPPSLRLPHRSPHRQNWPWPHCCTTPVDRDLLSALSVTIAHALTNRRQNALPQTSKSLSSALPTSGRLFICSDSMNLQSFSGFSMLNDSKKLGETRSSLNRSSLISDYVSRHPDYVRRSRDWLMFPTR